MALAAVLVLPCGVALVLRACAETAGLLESCDVICPRAFSPDPSSLEFLAVRDLLSRMDDDADGEVSSAEMRDFKEHELQGLTLSASTPDAAGPTADLLTLWMTSDVRQWTPARVGEWLSEDVALPQYASAAVTGRVDGRMIPLMAADNPAVMQDLLHIANPVHRKRLVLRSMDVVLFGRHTLSAAAGAWQVAVGVLCVLLVLALGELQRRAVTTRRMLLRLRREETRLAEAKDQLAAAAPKRMVGGCHLAPLRLLAASLAPKAFFWR